jgi:hypothetical protein
MLISERELANKIMLKFLQIKKIYNFALINEREISQ